MQSALDGCQAVFGVTNFWEHFGKEQEHGKNLVDAVAATGSVEHFVFSTLPHANKISGGAYNVPHFDIKAQLEDYTRERGLSATFVHVAFYYENFLTFFPPQKQADGTFAFGFPQGDTRPAALSIEDLGGVVAPLFAKPEEFFGKKVGVVGDDLTPQQYAEAMTRVLGKKVVYNHIPREVFAGFGFPGADDLADMFDFNRRFIPNRAADLMESRRLSPAIQTFEAWLNSNRDNFQAIIAA